LNTVHSSHSISVIIDTLDLFQTWLSFFC